MAQIITHSYTNRTVKPMYYGAAMVWYILGVVEVLLGLRFLLRLFGANPAAGFTDFIYDATVPLVDPFINVIRSARVESGIVEWSTLLAMLVYWLLGWAIVRLFFITQPVTEYETEEELRKDLT